MDPRKSSSARLTIACGLLAAAMGFFYMLHSAGIVGPPARHGSEEPGWLGFVFGLVFLLGGSTAIIKTAVAGDNPPEGDLPRTAPRWLRLVYHAMVLAIVAGLGMLFSWIAFGPGQREFSGSGSIFGEIGGRVAFGISAILIWIVVLAIAIHGARRGP